MLTPEQSEVIFDNTRQAVQNGIMRRYQDTLKALYDEWKCGYMNGVPIYTPEDLADFEEVGLDPYEDLQSYGAAISAEAPFAFGIDSRTHNVTGDAAALTMFKVDTRFGSEIESSSLAVGLVGEIGDEEPNNFVFTSSDIAFVLQCLKAQRNVGLTYVSFEQDDQVEWVYGL